MMSLDTPEECLPIYTLAELFEWTPRQHPRCSISSIKLSPKYKLKSDRRTLVCHDMNGGYTDDRFPMGVSDSNAYRFFHWPYVDIFVYFSHNFITIPPPAWTNSAHKHDVLILGTFITEWEEGAARCEEILSSEENFKNVADKMVAIAKHFGFDGWLLNIENLIKKEQIPMLHEFIRYLTAELHKEVPSSMVVYYDSVIESGQLLWQNALNEKNKQFFMDCDAIFLNYCWTEKKLAKSVIAAKECERLWDVYVGVDVFGRGCKGGGGFNSSEAVEAIRDHNLSVALFAQGWTYMEHGQQNFTEHEYTFWNLLLPYLNSRSIKSLPFYTSFCQGQGQTYSQNGKVTRHSPWTNLSLQSLQPQVLNCSKHLPNQEPQYQFSDIYQMISFKEAFNGGGCLSIGGKFSKPEDFIYSELFTFDDIMTNSVGNDVLVAYTVKTEPELHIFLDVLLWDRVNRKYVRYRLCDNAMMKDDHHVRIESNQQEEDTFTVCITGVKDIENLKWVVAMPDENKSSDWETRAYIFNNLEDYNILSVRVGVLCSSNVDSYPVEKFAHLGQIQISGTTSLEKIIFIQKPEVISSLIHQNEENGHVISFSCVLQWSCGQSQNLERFHIYYTSKHRNDSTHLSGVSNSDNNWKLIGTVLCSQEHQKMDYKISKLEIDIKEYDELELKVQPVYYNGISVMLADVPKVNYKISLD